MSFIHCSFIVQPLALNLPSHSIHPLYEHLNIITQHSKILIIILSFTPPLSPNSGSNPVLIASPAEMAGMTLESRLVTYDWKNQFDSFQQVTRQGSFKAICWDAKNTLIPVSSTNTTIFCF